jgi:hypothetical protein
MNLFNAKVPSNCASGPSAFLAVLWICIILVTWIRIRIKYTSGSASNKNHYPDPHQSDKLDLKPDPHQFADDKPKCRE